MINIYEFEVSTNGRDNVIDIVNTEYIIDKKYLNLVRRIIQNSLSVEYEEEIYVYLHYINLKK